MVRAIALSLFLLVGIGAVLPFVSDYAEAGAHKKHKNKKHRKYKKYSKNWWRAYYRRQARSKSLIAQRRALRLRQIRLANAVKTAGDGDNITLAAAKKQTVFVSSGLTAPALLPTGEEAPKGWKRGATSSPAELQFSVDDETGANLGSASIAVVGPALGAANNGGNKTVGGVQTSSLRRTVIDRMIREQGWVVNDYQKEIGGKKVFVVVAQAPGAGGTVQSRTFYFTEVGGQIYSLAASAPNGSSQRIEQESERVIASFGQRRTNGAVQQAELK